jgi:Lrp/AsnC family leucine-responsive transcriptional regulator
MNARDMSKSGVRLDRADQNILRVLREDGRIPLRHLAEKVHLSASAVHARVKRLIGRGLILGTCARIDPLLADVGPLLFLQVRLSSTQPSLVTLFQAAALKLPQVLECHLIAGKIDFILKARMPDAAACRAFPSLVHALPGVREVSVHVVEDSYKARAELMRATDALSAQDVVPHRASVLRCTEPAFEKA